MKREFEKIFNRSLPLFAAEYWYQGERIELPKITRKSIFYNPLFVYRKGKETNVYYDVTDYDENKRPIPDFFQKHPEKFAKIAREYGEICREMLRLAKTTKPTDFRKIFNLHISFWARFSVIWSLGDRYNKDRNSIIFKDAYKLRQETDKVEYISGNNLLELSEKIFPKHKKFVPFLTSSEIMNKRLPDLPGLRERAKGYMFHNGELHIDLSISEFKKRENIIFLKNSLTIPRHILEGVAAAKGKVVGRARIILSLNNLNKLREKEILVTSMTTPDYFVAMEKAIAFITDEGGITCHAAIVARELEKPCVIATKIATRVIRTGDLIEVDANRGLVRILERG
jgi:phosphoenolpyruvate synthase/pyruvate phosphate dikinase